MGRGRKRRGKRGTEGRGRERRGETEKKGGNKGERD